MPSETDDYSDNHSMDHLIDSDATDYNLKSHNSQNSKSNLVSECGSVGEHKEETGLDVNRNTLLFPLHDNICNYGNQGPNYQRKFLMKPSKSCSKIPRTLTKKTRKIKKNFENFQKQQQHRKRMKEHKKLSKERRGSGNLS